MAAEDEYQGFTASNEAITAATNIKAEESDKKTPEQK